VNSQELVHAALSAKPTGRPACGPHACHFCAGYFGIPLKDYTLEATTLAGSVIRYYSEFRPDDGCCRRFAQREGNALCRVPAVRWPPTPAENMRELIAVAKEGW